jgi:hypothetical protein
MLRPRAGVPVYRDALGSKNLITLNGFNGELLLQIATANVASGLDSVPEAARREEIGHLLVRL